MLAFFGLKKFCFFGLFIKNFVTLCNNSINMIKIENRCEDCKNATSTEQLCEYCIEHEDNYQKCPNCVGNCDDLVSVSYGFSCSVC